MMAWEPVGTYSEIYIDGEDGQRYTLGVDGDDNFYVEKQNPARVLLALQPTQYRLCRQVPDGEVRVTRDQLVLMQEAMRFAWEGFKLRPQYDQTAARMQRLDNWIGEMLAQTKGGE